MLHKVAGCANHVTPFQRSLQDRDAVASLALDPKATSRETDMAASQVIQRVLASTGTRLIVAGSPCPDAGASIANAMPPSL
jgi:hypothetical protein